MCTEGCIGLNIIKEIISNVGCVEIGKGFVKIGTDGIARGRESESCTGIKSGGFSEKGGFELDNMQSFIASGKVRGRRKWYF